MQTPEVPAATATYMVNLTLQELTLIEDTLTFVIRAANSNRTDTTISERDRAYYEDRYQKCVGTLQALAKAREGL